MKRSKFPTLIKKLCFSAVLVSGIFASADVKALDITVDGTTYDVQFYTGSFNAINAANSNALKSTASAPWWGNSTKAKAFRDAYLEATKASKPFDVTSGDNNDVLAFGYDESVSAYLYLDNGGNPTDPLGPSVSSAGSYTIHYAYVAPLAPSVTGVSSSTSDGSYKAGKTVSIEVTFSEEVVG